MHTRSGKIPFKKWHDKNMNLHTTEVIQIVQQNQIQKQIMLLHCFLFIIESTGAAEFTHCTFKKWCINTETEFQEIV